MSTCWLVQQAHLSGVSNQHFRLVHGKRIPGVAADPVPPPVAAEVPPAAAAAEFLLAAAAALPAAAAAAPWIERERGAEGLATHGRVTSRARLGVGGGLPARERMSGWSRSAGTVFLIPDTTACFRPTTPWHQCCIYCDPGSGIRQLLGCLMTKT